MYGAFQKKSANFSLCQRIDPKVGHSKKDEGHMPLDA